jgi:hypothetical protein
MLRSTFRYLTRGLTRRPSPARKPSRPRSWQPALEELETRLVPAVSLGIQGGVLTAQCDSAANTVTVDHVVIGGKGFAEINGGAGAKLFADTSYSSIHILGGAGGTTTKVHSNVKPLTVFGDSNKDVVNLGDTSNKVQGIQGTVLVEDEKGFFSTVNVNDQGDSAARTVTLSSVPRPGGLTSLGQVSGLGAAAIQWDYHDTSAVNLRLGTGAGTVNVLGTGVTTNVFNSANATVNVGSSSSVAGIKGSLHLENEGGKDTVNINSQLDAAKQIVTLKTIGGLGAVTGLPGGGQITWDYDDTSAVNLNLGHGATTVIVQGIGVTTNINNSADTTIEVGTGSLAAIKGALSLDNDGGITSLFVNDLNDHTGQVFNFNRIAGDDFFGTFEQITGSVFGTQGSITFDNSDTSSVDFSAGDGGNLLNINTTGTAMTISGGNGANTFEVGSGNLGSDIGGPLTLHGGNPLSAMALNDIFNPTNNEVYNFNFSQPGTGSLSLQNSPLFDLVFTDMDNFVNLATNGSPFETVNAPPGDVNVVS